jgi:AraC-like DNA-binding protein
MSRHSLSALPACPPLLARAPRASRLSHSGREPHSRLYVAPPGLHGAVVAVVCRDMRDFALNDAQRLTHFPASPLVCLSWYQWLDAGLVEQTAEGAQWRPFGTAVTLSGSQSRPTVSWAPGSGRGGMICFTADVAQTLFGVDPAAIHDRFCDAFALLDDSWRPFLAALLEADDDTATLAALVHHLAPRWLALRPAISPAAVLHEAGRRWVARLAWQAREWRTTHSPRQVERRIKAFSGRSLREWQMLVKTEGAFFSARERFDAGNPVDWAALAHEEGFADQAHLSRAVRRTTGFSPREFVRRFEEDESFWMYRLWV